MSRKRVFFNGRAAPVQAPSYADRHDNNKQTNNNNNNNNNKNSPDVFVPLTWQIDRTRARYRTTLKKKKKRKKRKQKKKEKKKKTKLRATSSERDHERRASFCAAAPSSPLLDEHLRLITPLHPVSRRAALADTALAAPATTNRLIVEMETLLSAARRVTLAILSRREAVDHGETKILKLKNLRPQDYANYSCVASVRNVCGIPDRSVIFRLTNKTASPSIKLLVEDPIVVNPGQTVSLVCITTGGDPSPLLNWASSNDSLPRRSLVKGGTLTLPAITSDEAGVYSCIASNNVGNPAKKSTTIVVRGVGVAGVDVVVREGRLGGRRHVVEGRVRSWSCDREEACCGGQGEILVM
ncbi:hypothetical protein CRUP_005237 [Coryphaenoides rupestris]|nr:hypothetical protein CRUP_005237 [Coryphaenoides rupestris]